MSEEKDIAKQALIRAYILETLSPEEREGFETQMAQDAALQEEVALERSLLTHMNEADWELMAPETNKERLNELRTALRSEESRELSTMIKEVGVEYRERTTRSPRRNFFYAIAASIAVLVSVTSYFMFKQTTLESYYYEYANWTELHSFIEKDEGANAMAKGEILYKAQQYQETIDYFKKLLENASEAQRPFIFMYLGASYLELEKYETALHTFELLTKTNTIESSRGYWYQLLVYLKLEQKEQVSKTLSLILSDVDNYNYSKALELQEKLK
ncbi:hypothetical protein RQM59_12080 [Flavobacteriaceae bacterium S356]|uniref:Tetratricopeptide repeat protein n=1 Tax=Asprobacillus argus TaxID=3076534 RepID=A0ABU3LHC4_9FLAO|nr:hypothetical protein [Flavobacteriaceae bacterium S356]